MQITQSIVTSEDCNYLQPGELDDFLRMYLETYMPVTDAPAEYLVTAILPAIGAAISTNRWIKWGTKNIYPNIWAMLVGQSTLMRKSTALNIGSHILRQLNEENSDRHYILPNDGSLAGFLEVLNSEKNGILVHSEVASMLENMSKGYNLSMKSLFTDFFDVPSQHKIRMKGEGEIIIVKPIFGIASGTTMNWLKQNITKSDRESGFLARFLYCHREIKDRTLAIPCEADAQRVYQIRQIFGKLIQCEPMAIQLDKAFEEAYSSFYNEVEAMLRNPLLDDGTKSFLGRLQTDYYLKLTILLCTLKGKTTADIEVATEVSYLAKFYLQQAVHIMGSLLKTDMASNQEKILVYMNERGRISTTELYRLFNNRLHAKNLHATMKGLEDAGLVRKITKDKTSYYVILRDSQGM